MIRLGGTVGRILGALVLLVGGAALATAARAEEDSALFSSFIVDQLEHRWQKDSNFARWDIEAWLGGDTNRFWLRSEGDPRMAGGAGDAEVSVYYGRQIAPFWDLLVGVRQDVVYGPGRNRERTHAVLSAEGLAPFRIELEPSLFVSDEGDVSARITATTDWYVTQRVIAQPRIELNASAGDADAFGTRSGINDVELGLRLRFELRRELAPYVGFSWIRRLGDTADLARSRGEGASDAAFVVGLRLWL